MPDVAVNVTSYVPSAPGNHANTPVNGSKVAPAGRPETESVIASPSGSLAVTVKFIPETISSVCGLEGIFTTGGLSGEATTIVTVTYSVSVASPSLAVNVIV